MGCKSLEKDFWENDCHQRFPALIYKMFEDVVEDEGNFFYDDESFSHAFGTEHVYSARYTGPQELKVSVETESENLLELPNLELPELEEILLGEEFNTIGQKIFKTSVQDEFQIQGRVAHWELTRVDSKSRLVIQFVDIEIGREVRI